MCTLTAGHEELVAEAHYELGKSEIAAENVKQALKQFGKSLVIWERIPQPEGICKAHSQLALAYQVFTRQLTRTHEVSLH